MNQRKLTVDSFNKSGDSQLFKTKETTHIHLYETYIYVVSLILAAQVYLQC